MLFARECPAVPACLLPPPAPLPSLPVAFSRRAALFGTTASAGALAVAPMAIPATSPAAWLVELAQDMAAADRGVDAILAANPQGYGDDPAWERLTVRFRSLFREMERMPAITATGLHAKAQALQIPWVSENEGYTARLGASLATDVRHLCADAVQG